MRVPTIFIPKNKKELDPESIKLLGKDLECLVLGNVNGIGCDEKTITKLTDTYLQKPPLEGLGVKSELVKTVITTKYGGDFNSITILEYETDLYLLGNLEEICEKGTKYFDRHAWCNIKFAERFLFRDNISVYIQGNKEFIQKAIECYQSLSFEKLAEEDEST